jgi:hypothetical protein
MKKTFVLAALLLTAACFTPQTWADKNKENKDCKFLGHAADSSVLWTLLGSLAETNSTNFALPVGSLSQTNSTNALVQSLGGLLATNHTVLFSNASALQQTNACRGSNELSGKQLKALAKLSRLTGPKFDKAFLAFVIEETSEAMEDAREAAVEAKSYQVRAFARHQLVALTHQFVDALAAAELVFGGDFDDLDVD